MRCILMRAVFLTRCRATILRCRIRRPHIMARLPSPINRRIFARHWTLHVSPLVLWATHLMPVVLTIHVTPIILRTSNFAVHCAIIHSAVDTIVHAAVHDPIVRTPVGTIIDAMVSYWPRCNHIVSAELSRTCRGSDSGTPMIHRCQEFPITARTVLVLDLHMRSFKVTLVHESFIVMRRSTVDSAWPPVESHASPLVDYHGAVINMNVRDPDVVDTAVVIKI